MKVRAKCALFLAGVYRQPGDVFDVPDDYPLDNLEVAEPSAPSPAAPLPGGEDEDDVDDDPDESEKDGDTPPPPAEPPPPAGKKRGKK